MTSFSRPTYKRTKWEWDKDKEPFCTSSLSQTFSFNFPTSTSPGFCQFGCLRFLRNKKWLSFWKVFPQLAPFWGMNRWINWWAQNAHEIWASFITDVSPTFLPPTRTWRLFWDIPLLRPVCRRPKKDKRSSSLQWLDLKMAIETTRCLLNLWKGTHVLFTKTKNHVQNFKKGTGRTWLQVPYWNSPYLHLFTLPKSALHRIAPAAVVPLQ